MSSLSPHRTIGRAGASPLALDGRQVGREERADRPQVGHDGHAALIADRAGVGGDDGDVVALVDHDVADGQADDGRVADSRDLDRVEIADAIEHHAAGLAGVDAGHDADHVDDGLAFELGVDRLGEPGEAIGPEEVDGVVAGVAGDVVGGDDVAGGDGRLVIVAGSLPTEVTIAGKSPMLPKAKGGSSVIRGTSEPDETAVRLVSLVPVAEGRTLMTPNSARSEWRCRSRLRL